MNTIERKINTNNTPEKGVNEAADVPGHGRVKIIELGKRTEIKNKIITIKCVDERPIEKISIEENELSIKNEHINRMPENYENSAAIPGGTLGIAMIAKAAFPQISPREAVNLTIGWQNSMNIPLSIHEHCGHLELASGNPTAYGLKKDDVTKMNRYLREKAAKGEIIINSPRLWGGHNGKYIQEVTTDENDPKTVTQTDSKGESSFKIDATINRMMLRSFASFIIEQNRKEVSGKLIQETKEELNDRLNEIYDTHGKLTFGKLAENLPRFRDDLRKDKPPTTPTITHVGFVEPIPQRA